MREISCQTFLWLCYSRNHACCVFHYVRVQYVYIPETSEKLTKKENKQHNSAHETYSAKGYGWKFANFVKFVNFVITKIES